MLSDNQTPRTCVSLFLPRVELNQVYLEPGQEVDYITEAFYREGYGVVSKVYPLEKTDFKTGCKYYSAIVHFEKWFCSDTVSNFILDLERTKMGNKFFHNKQAGKYWFVQKHVDDRDARAEAKRKMLAEEDKITQAIRASKKALAEVAEKEIRLAIWNELREQDLVDQRVKSNSI